MDLWEVHYTKIIEANDFFDAVDKAREIQKNEAEVVSVCPAYIEDEYIE